MKKQEAKENHFRLLIRSVESAINWSHQINEAQAVRDRSFEARYNSSSEIADLGLDDYARFLDELKISLAQYVMENNNRDSMKSVETIIADPESAETVLNTILLYLKSEKS